MQKQDFLKSPDLWSEDFVKKTAQTMQLNLKDAHWQIIQLVRDYYNKHQHHPSIRTLIILLRKEKGFEEINSLKLQEYFPLGAAKQIALLSGLPYPKHCI